GGGTARRAAVAVVGSRAAGHGIAEPGVRFGDRRVADRVGGGQQVGGPLDGEVAGSGCAAAAQSIAVPARPGPLAWRLRLVFAGGEPGSDRGRRGTAAPALGPRDV